MYISDRRNLSDHPTWFPCFTVEETEVWEHEMVCLWWISGHWQTQTPASQRSLFLQIEKGPCIQEGAGGREPLRSSPALPRMISLFTPSPVAHPTSLPLHPPAQLWDLTWQASQAQTSPGPGTDSPARCKSEGLVPASPGLPSSNQNPRVARWALKNSKPVWGSQSKQRRGHQATDKGKRCLWWFPLLECTSTTRGWNGDPETSPSHLHRAKSSSTPHSALEDSDPGYPRVAMENAGPRGGRQWLGKAHDHHRTGKREKGSNSPRQR